MSRFTVPIKDILGSAFYNYELTSSTYNPTIDTSFTITCKVTNSFGNNVSGKSIILYKDGTSVSSATTNSSGVATWTVTLDDWDNHHFHCNNATLDLSATGCKIIHPHTYYWVYEWEDKAGVKIHINTNINFPTSWTNINNFVIPHRLAPIYPVTELNVVTANTGIGVRESNDNQATEIIAKSLTGSQVSANCYAYLEWSKQ